MKFCAIDTESGGRQTDCTLLTAYFLILDNNFNKIEDLYLELKPDGNAPYIINAQGMGVNKINIVEHDRVAVPYKDAKPTLFNFLKRNSNGERLTPIGHAIKGDINRIISNLISEGSWEQFCTYHFIDTSVVLQFLRVCGKISENIDGSIESLVKYFNIKQYMENLPHVEKSNLEFHDAKIDAEMTVEVLKKFVSIARSDYFTDLMGT